MVRHVEGDDFLLKYLSSVANDYKCAVGLILGQSSSQKYNVIHFAKTPPFQSEEEKTVSKSVKTIKSISEVNDGWIADHAQQTTRMLPGGMHVLGIFAVSDEELLNPFHSKLKSLLNAMNKQLSLKNYFSGTNENEKLVVHYSSKTQKYLAKTYDVVTSNVQPADFRFLQKASKWINLECIYEIDHIYYLKASEKHGPLRKHIKVILDDINTNLETGTILFDNELKDEDEKIENIGKKKKVPRGSSNKITQDSNDKPIHVSIFEQCVFQNPSENVELVTVGGQIRVVGEVVSKLWLNGKVTIKEARKAVVEDIMRSLVTRMEMHWDSLTEEELGEDLNSVHEPPRRVLITLPESNVTISDYLFPGEGPEDVKASLEELLDIKQDGQLEISDLEGQADITQYYKGATETESEDFLPKISRDANKFMYLVGLGAALVVLLLSLIIHFYL